MRSFRETMQMERRLRTEPRASQPVEERKGRKNSKTGEQRKEGVISWAKHWVKVYQLISRTQVS